MRKIFLIGLALLSIFSVKTVFGGAPNVTSFPYQKDVIIPAVSWEQKVAIDLDDTTMHQVNQRFSNINIYDSQNEEVPFQVYYDEFARITDSIVLTTSSHKDGKVEFLVDNDPLSTFIFDEKIDKADASWYIVDLGEPQRVVRAKIFVPEGRVRYMEIKGGMTQEDMRTLVSKRPYIWQSDFHSPLVRYLKVSLWGVGVKVDDSKFYHGDKASMYFDAKPQEKYRVLYGGPVDLIRYKKRTGSAQKYDIQGQLTKEIFNPSFPEDFDEDGLNNDVDNCPFISNASQSDSDEDRVGNKCDNASEVKNANQYDTDFDGVGDIIDNCMLMPNPDQKDRDKDGYGDECDNANAQDIDKEVVESNRTIIAFVIGFILAMGIVVGWLKREFLKATVKRIKKQ